MNCTDLELECRYQEVFDQYVAICPKVAEMLEKYGRIRTELTQLLAEMQQRKLPTKLEYPPEAYPSGSQEHPSGTAPQS